MVLIEIGSAGVISAYFFRRMISDYSLNVSDPIEGQPVQLSYYLCAFGCGLVFWLLALLWAKLRNSDDRQADIHEVATLAKLIAPITTLNLCGCLLAPFMKLPLLVRFLVLFQVSSNLALLLIWAFLSLKECMILLDAHTQQQQKSSPEPQAVQQQKSSPEPQAVQQQKPSPEESPKPECSEGCDAISQSSRFEGAGKKPKEDAVHSFDGVGSTVDEAEVIHHFDRVFRKVDKAGGSGSGHGSGASGSGGGNEGGVRGSDGGGDRGASGSGSGHGSGARGSGGGNEGGDRGSDAGGDRGASGSGHGSGARGSGGGNEGGDRGSEGGGDRGASGSGHGSGASGSGGRDGGLVDHESGGRGTNKEEAFESNKIIKMSMTLTAQTTGTLMGFHLMQTPSSSSKVLLVVALLDQLVAYLCGVTGIMLSSNKPEDSKAAKIFAGIGFVCYTLGYILMIAMYVAMYVPWYSVLIIVLLFGVVWLVLFWNGLKPRATEVWNYLKERTQSIKNCIGMPFESGN